MDTKKRIGGSTFSIAWIAGAGREFFISRPPGESLAWLWDMISPQSFYLSMTILGFGGLLYFCWPAVSLVQSNYINWRYREKIEAEKMMRKELELKSAAIKLIKPFLILHHDELFHIRPRSEQMVQAEELKQRLINTRILPEEFMHGTHTDAGEYLDGLFPYIVRHGAKKGIAEYRELLDKENSEDYEGDEDT